MIDAITTIDSAVLDALFAVRNPLWVAIFIAISEFGRTLVIYALTLGGTVALVHAKKFALAMGLLISNAFAGILLLVLKGIIARERPAPDLQAYLEAWYSFPSAHATFAISLYGFLALAAWHALKRGTYRYCITAGLVALTVAISFSRLYLGVHFLSDVLAGIALGIVCVWFGWKYGTIARNGDS